MVFNKSKFVAVPRLPGLKNCEDFPPLPGSSSGALPGPPTSQANLGTSQSAPRNSQSNANKDAGESHERVKQEYDVYAKPFVPEFLRTINQESAHIVVTESKHKVDFAAYTASFAGGDFLPERPIGPALSSTRRGSNEERTLDPHSYLDYFVALCRIEMAAKETYCLYNVRLFPYLGPDAEDLWMLSLPGLREDSPHLQVEMGDTILLRQLWIDGRGFQTWFEAPGKSWEGIQYNASVYAVNRALEQVYLRISGLSTTSITTYLFNVTLPLRQSALQSQWNSLSRMHQELQKTSRETDTMQNDWIRRMIFPVESDGKTQTKLRSLPHKRGLYDDNINYEQLQAVNSACVNEFGVLPFLISGPPGTGKTKTLVEIALQLLETTDVKHILICAPSDQAADTLVSRLRTILPPTELLRLIGPQRADNEVPREILGYCYRVHDMFYLPPMPQLWSYSIVVTSTRDASLLVDARLTNNDMYHVETNMKTAFYPGEMAATPLLHWGALLMDEAAQATELDALPALSVVMPPSDYPTDLPQPRVIMAGDQNQLGPRTASRNTQFSCSLFARLFDRTPYKNHPLSRSNIRPSEGAPVFRASMLPMLYPPFVNLFRNYRSHPSIISVPSSQFYNDTLIPEAQLEDTPLQKSSLWQGKKWPVLYVPITGKDELEKDGGGWYNITEAREACNIAQRLVKESQVAQADIAIMSPFAAQVKVLRKMIRGSAYGGGSGLWEVNIGPVEAFQGLESRVVILCTTRTRERFLDEDAKRGLGLIGQMRKMNVALTRAKMGLFVLGNPSVLGMDEHWRAFLAFCWRNELVAGASPFDEEMVKSFEGCKGGVLEKALRVREDLKVRKALGSAVAVNNIGGLNDDHEEVMMALCFQAAVEDEYREEDYEDYEEDGGDQEEGEDQTDGAYQADGEEEDSEDEIDGDAHNSTE